MKLRVNFHLAAAVYINYAQVEREVGKSCDLHGRGKGYIQLNFHNY